MTQDLNLKTKSRDNLYLVLDLMPGASHNEILHAYNRAKNTYSGGSLASYSLLDPDSSEDVLKEIEAAYLILGNPSKRREYDIKMGFQTWGEDEAKNGQSLSEKQNSENFFAKPTIAGKSNDTKLEGSVAAKALDIPSQVKSFNKKEASSFDLNDSKPSGVNNSDVVSSSPNTSTREAPGGGKFEPNPEFEKQIQNCVSVDGGFLRAVRVYRSYTIEALAHRTKLTPGHVAALENEDSQNLPAPVYLRGHVYLVCQALGLPNPNGLAKSYLDRLSAQNKLQKRPF